MRFERQKEKLIRELKSKGIESGAVLNAIKKVPRHAFIPSAFEFQAYDDKALPIGYGQTISHPYTVAKMTELLQIKKGDKMPTYVILGKWTQKRIETIKNLPDAIKEGTKAFETYGVKIKVLVFTMGRYDVVAIGEAPNEEVITKALLSWGSKGLLRTETLTGFTPEKMVEMIKSLP